MDEEVLKQLKDTILKTINSGIAYPHMTPIERDKKERELVEYLQGKGYEVFVEECMIYVIGKQWDKILMLELTRNTLYFTPFKMAETSEIVFYILQLISKKYLDGIPKKKTKKKVTKKQEEIEEDSDEDTEEEPKPPPDFSFL